MKIKLLIASLLISGFALGQTPKEHKFYDTVKTMREHIDYSPDTIPVYFKELIITKHQEKPNNANAIIANDVYERWSKGFVIWQTYHNATTTTYNDLGGSFTFGDIQNTLRYYITPYNFDSWKADGKFLYEDYSKVTNPVTTVIKR